jgi:predicted Fe-S protein YdhL (DUF1289 family)
VGDAICKGCKRTIAEVRDWNRFSPDEKMQRMEELKVRDITTFVIPIEILD